jgi:hypothetical protein
MKTLYKSFIIAQLLGLTVLQAQKKVGIGTNAPKAVLDISSSTAGLLTPSVATASKPSITVNNLGNLVYVNNEPMKSFWYAEKQTTPTWKQWLFSDNVSNFNDPSVSWVRHGNKGFGPSGGFLGTTDNVELLLKTNATTAIRIETNQNTTINQKLFVSNVPVNDQATNGTIKFIGIDNTTKEVVQLAKPGDAASLFYVPFEISKGATTNVQITDYDTRIPVADYFVTVANKSLVESGNTSVFIQGVTNGSYFLPNVEVFQSGGTWRIRANYGSNTLDTDGMTDPIVNTKWKIGLLVFNKQIIKDMGTINVNMGNILNNTQTLPVGL